MSDFLFAEPQRIHALWGVLIFGAGLIYLERRAGNQLREFVSTLLQQRLVSGPTAGQRNARHVMLVLACVFAVLALMRPQWGVEYVKSSRASAELMVAIDVSRSMLAEDVIPNRLDRAKAEVRDLLEYLAGDQVGLIGFAGRASVLAPMTPDFGFFRLVLNSLGPNSVGRGGTRLEEPIRKAMAGFKATGDVSRVLVLITDGEDQDSFPIEAAKDAAKRGIRIIAIGFGSESGSEIPLTDPETGARTFLRDSEGKIVMSRLDGDTLRQMALLTDGVYVPAGTGALDLESIYREHIAGLMRSEIDSRRQVVRSEGFQWFVLAAIVCLMVSVLIGQGGRGRQRSRTKAATPLVIALLASHTMLAIVATPARAEDPLAVEAASTSEVTSQELQGLDSSEAAALVSDGEAESGDTSKQEEGPEDPRVAYNDASDQLSTGNFDEAARLFEVAISASGTDGETRYRATYGLGWTAAARADSLLESEPEMALEALYRAGDYFREAVRLQPANDDPRHNLEIVLQRANVLADTLARKDEKDIVARLDELIERQRGEVSAVRGLLETIAPEHQGAQLPDSYRREFRGLSTQQRQLLSESDTFAERVDREKTTLEGVPEEERSPEDQVRVVQLEQLEIHLQRARERMGHARRELRARRGPRAYRRASAALDALKRARDQLRDPVQILDALLRDGSELARYTQAMAVLGARVPGAASSLDLPEIPPWLTNEYLEETQQGIVDRTSEFDERLAVGVAQAAAQPVAEPTSQEEAQEFAERQRFMQQVADASPLVSTAASDFRGALLALETDGSRGAAAQQFSALAALAEAREQFLDLRRIIELTYGDQHRVQGVLSPPEGAAPPGPRPEIAEYLPSLRDAEVRNIARVDRIASLIDEERAGLPAEGAAGEEAGGEEAVAQARERFDLADQILLLTRSSMKAVLESLADPVSGSGDEESWRSAIAPGEQAVKGLDSLRRLFFSLIEHLREAAQRQQELNDETESQAAVPEDELPASLGPLIPRQSDLAEITGVIANALEQQSLEDPGLADGDPAAGGQEGQGVKLRLAAELTLEAQIEMEQGGEKLSAEAPDLRGAREHQDLALVRLVEALEELKPPEQEGEQGDESQQNQEQNEQEQEQGQEGEPQQSPEPSPEADPSQLLQEVRDREAERRRENAERKGRGYDTVERDW